MFSVPWTQAQFPRSKKQSGQYKPTYKVNIRWKNMINLAVSIWQYQVSETNKYREYRRQK